MGEVSVWFKGHETHIGGVTHQTTAAELLRFALSQCVWPTSEKARRSSRCYALFENWRGCQRIIPPWKRIYKLWKLWGLERMHVKFVVKKVAMETLARKDFEEYVEASRLKVPKRHVAFRMEPHEVGDAESNQTSSSEGVGLFLLDESEIGVRHPPETARKRTLFNRVLRQNDKLRDISHTVDEVDEEILFYEAKLHHYRVVEGGKDYVQEAYLAETCPKGHARSGPRRSRGSVKSVKTVDVETFKQPNEFSDVMQHKISHEDLNLSTQGKTNIHEDVRKDSGYSEVKLVSRNDLSKKSKTKILVVNPLPRSEMSPPMEADDNQEVVKKGDVSFPVPADEMDSSESTQIKTPQRPNRRHHRYGGKVKKRMPGLYEFEQSCEWLKVMDKELKRLESMENLSFVDWDSESLLSDKDLSLYGNRKYKFRPPFSSKNGKRTSDKQTTSELLGKELVKSFSNLYLDRKPCEPSENDGDLPQWVVPFETKVADEKVEGAILKSASTLKTDISANARNGMRSVNDVTVTRRDLNCETGINYDARCSNEECEPLVQAKAKPNPSILKKNTPSVERQQGTSAVKYDTCKQVGLHESDCVTTKIPRDMTTIDRSSKGHCYIVNTSQIITDSEMFNNGASEMSTRISNSVKTNFDGKMTKDTSPISMDFNSRKPAVKQVTFSPPSPVAPFSLDKTKISRPRSTPHSDGSILRSAIVEARVGKCIQRSPPIPEKTLNFISNHVTMATMGNSSGAGLWCVDKDGKPKMDDVTRITQVGEFVRGDGNGHSRPILPPQFSPMTVRRVPKPPVYYSTEDIGPVLHIPNENQSISRKLIKKKHDRNVGQNAGARNPRIERLRTTPLQGTPSAVSETIENNTRQDINQNNIFGAKIHVVHSSVVGIVTGALTPTEGTFHESENGLVVPKQSTPTTTPAPIKDIPPTDTLTGILKTTTTHGTPSRVLSPDQGLGPELYSPSKMKIVENDSSSENGMGSVHSQDSGILSNVSVALETWV